MRLRRAGRQYVGLCPFHRERHPSCYVHPEKQIWKCFGCGAGGDLLNFVMLAEHCDFFRALRIVSDFPSGGSERGTRSGPSERRGLPPGHAKHGTPHSQLMQESRAQILSRLDATNRRLARIAATNAAASAALATACEPDRCPTNLLEETE
jgi:hypothetical protein